MSIFSPLAGSSVSLLESVQNQIKLWEQMVDTRIWQSHPLGEIRPGYNKGIFFSLEIDLKFHHPDYQYAHGVLKPMVLCSGYGRIALWVGFDHFIDGPAGTERQYRYEKLGRFPDRIEEIDWVMHGHHDSCWTNWSHRVVNEFARFYTQMLPEVLHDSEERTDTVSVDVGLGNKSTQGRPQVVWVRHEENRDLTHDVSGYYRRVVNVINPKTEKSVTPW